VVATEAEAATSASQPTAAVVKADMAGTCFVCRVWSAVNAC